MTEPDVPSWKGSTVREALLWYERGFGIDATVALVDELPPDLERFVDRTRPALGILAAGWYPVSLGRHIADRVIAGRDDEGRELARDANRDIVPKMIRGIYRTMYESLASPELYARHVDRLWRRLHTTGHRRVDLVRPGEALSIVSDWAGHHPLHCWMTIHTMATLFEMMKLGDVTVDRVRCVAHGDGECATVVRWSARR